jgi:hypothetical protein
MQDPEPQATRRSARNAEEAIFPANVFVDIRARDGSKFPTRDLTRNKKTTGRSCYQRNRYILPTFTSMVL